MGGRHGDGTRPSWHGSRWALASGIDSLAVTVADWKKLFDEAVGQLGDAAQAIGPRIMDFPDDPLAVAQIGGILCAPSFLLFHHRISSQRVLEEIREERGTP